MSVGKVLILVGIVLVVFGVLWLLGEQVGLGRLPGDIVVRRERYTFYFPLATCLLLSILLSLFLWLASAREPMNLPPARVRPKRGPWPLPDQAWVRGHDHPGRAQDPLVQTVTGFEDLDHGARRHVGPGLLLHPLVQVGVERLAQGVDGGDAEAAEDLEQLRLHQGHSLDQRALLCLLPGGVQGPLQVVQDRQQLAGEGGMGVAPLLGQVALDALLVVLEIGPDPLEQGEILIPLLLGDRDPAPQRLQVLQDGRRHLVLRPFPDRPFSTIGSGRLSISHN